MNLDFLQNTQIRSALSVAGVTFFLSALISTIAGAGFFTILWRAFLFGALMGALTAVLIEALRKLVPEVMELFESKEGLSSSESSEELFEESDSGQESEISDAPLTEGGGDASVTEDIHIDEGEVSRQKAAKPRKKAKEGDIIAEGVALENNPELMAEAVKHIIDTDKDET